MELVIGGAFQGKLAYALETYGLTESDVCDLAVCDPAPGYRCYRHLEALSRREPDAERYLPLFENAVVPMDGEERAWRERYGLLLQKFARNAAHVTRIFCGLSEVLK